MSHVLTLSSVQGAEVNAEGTWVGQDSAAKLEIY